MRVLKLLSIAIANVGLCAALLSAARSHAVHAQETPAAGLQLTTAERIQTEDWWPTKSTFPLKAFAGSEACVQCHSDESTGSSAMQRAAKRAPDGSFLHGNAASFSSKPLRYELTATADGLDYSVGNGTATLNQRLEWMMGAGELGRTFLYESEHHWFQSEATYYTHLSGLDITTGLSFDSAAPLSAALGVPLSVSDARACFGCHTVHATTSAGFEPAHAEAGLGCEACHGPAQAHVTSAAVHEADGHGGSSAGVFNPAKLPPVDSIDFCGACHRTFADAVLALGNQRSTAAVRFQPYRLEESKCWRATQSEKLTCVSCHNPHQPLSHDPAMYDRRCLSCHTAAEKNSIHQAMTNSQAALPCPKATKNCTSCHMPKVAVPSMHGDFTDHFIRIPGADNAFPK